MSSVFKPDGYGIRVLDPLFGSKYHCLPAIPRCYTDITRGRIVSLALYKDKYLIAAFDWEIVAVWNLRKSSVEIVISFGKQRIRGVNVYKDYLVILCMSGDIKIYSILNYFSLVKVAAQLKALMYSIDSSEKHQLLFASGHTRTINYIDISDPSNPHLVPSRQVALHESSLSVRVIDDETKLVSGEGSSIVIIDIATSSILHRFDKSCGSPHERGFWSTIEVGDKYVAAAGINSGSSSKISIWNYRTGKLHKVLKLQHNYNDIHHLQTIQCHDGRNLLYSLDGRDTNSARSKVYIWDIDKDFEFVKSEAFPDTDNHALAVLDNRRFSKSVQRIHKLLMQVLQANNPPHADVTIFT